MSLRFSCEDWNRTSVRLLADMSHIHTNKKESNLKGFNEI